MKRCFFVAVVVLFSAVWLPAQTPDRSKVVSQLRGLIKEQRQEIDRLADNEKKKDQYARELWTEHEKAQAQVNQVGAERDGWKSYGEAEHDGRINAEKRVAEEKVKKQRWVMIASAVSVLMLTYLGLKFFTPLRAIL